VCVVDTGSVDGCVSVCVISCCLETTDVRGCRLSCQSISTVPTTRRRSARWLSLGSVIYSKELMDVAVVSVMCLLSISSTPVCLSWVRVNRWTNTSAYKNSWVLLAIYLTVFEVMASLMRFDAVDSLMRQNSGFVYLWVAIRNYEDLVTNCTMKIIHALIFSVMFCTSVV